MPISNGEAMTLVDSKNAKTLFGVAESMTSYLRAHNLGSGESVFGRRAIEGVDGKKIKSIVKTLADNAWKQERITAAENAGLNTNFAINAKVREEIAEKSKKEYVARAENYLQSSQHSGGVLSNITTYQQLFLVALIQGTISPVYSKIFKTLVDPSPMITRMISYPEIIDHNGNTAPLIDVINDNKKILEMTAGAGANIRFVLPVTNSSINLNVIDEYTAQLGTAKKTIGPRNYINRGFSIIEMDYDGKKVPLSIVSMENHTQSGEISDTVGVINTTIKAQKPGDDDILIYGKVDQNGDVRVTVSDPKVRSLKFQFNLPPVGIQNPYTVRHRNAKHQHVISQNAKASCTLNEMFLDDHIFYVGKDAIELFNTDILEITGAQKDAFCLNSVDNLIEELRNSEDQPYVNEAAYFEHKSRKKLFEDSLDMNVAAETLRLNDATTSGNNLMLAQRLFKLLNNIDRFMNPKERNFTLYSASSGVQWLKDAYGNNVSKFNIVGNAGNEIAGISTLYDVIRANIGELYNVNYVATNRKQPIIEEKDNSDYPNSIPTGKKADVESLEIIAVPAFEETKDTVVVVSGKEYLDDKGTGTAEDPASASLNYQHRYDFIKYNKVLGFMKFTEIPTSFKS